MILALVLPALSAAAGAVERRWPLRPACTPRLRHDRPNLAVAALSVRRRHCAVGVAGLRQPEEIRFHRLRKRPLSPAA